MQTADSADLDRDRERPENRRGTARQTLPGLRRYLCGGFCLAGMIVFQNCAKVGAPEPPLVRVPSPSTDLAAQEHPDGIVLTVSMPTLNTDGSLVSTLKEIEVYRVSESGRGPWEPLPQDEFLWRAERIVSVSDDFSHFLHADTLSFTDPIPAADRAAAYRNSFRYAVRFINNKNQTAGLGNQVTIAPVPLPLPPADLSAEVSQDAVRIRWSPPAENDDGSRPATIAGYEIYRSEDPKSPSSAPLNSSLLLKPELEDRTFQFDKTYYYVVSAVASTEKPYAEGGTSAPLAVTPVDKFPPGAPSDLHAVMDRGVVVLLWAAPEAPDIAGYRVYRAEGANEVPKMLGQGLVTGLSLRDDAVRPGVRYRYSVSAVDTHGNEGPPAETSIEVP
jgi:hypothetical protein